MTVRARRFLVRVAVSSFTLLILVFVVDVDEVVERLAGLDEEWIAVGLAVSIGQVVASAWRWRYTARRLGVALPVRDAIEEYYLGTFLNQVLPGGVLGDVSRAWRHARSTGPAPASGEGRARRLRSVHAVILERASGQAVMTLAAFFAGAVLLAPRTETTASWLPDHPLTDVPLVVSLPAALATVIFLGWLLGLLLRRAMRMPALDRFLEDARTALLGSALPVQAGLSLLIVGSYVAVFVAAARAAGVETPSSALLPLVPPLLVTMLVPVSVAGWGIREGAAALLWSSVGLTASEGVAVSVTYGLVVLVSSLPGAAVLLLILRSERGPDRRGGRPPD
ncbi:MAG: lysylphosphatidylglycerol synthase transmembrane domain-containing protein [Longimicrobiales bacterium]|nr:lysylphosphatidylglycerol synthase transmembrane domain-containing protein [Longimicrobiales bacterium]